MAFDRTTTSELLARRSKIAARSEICLNLAANEIETNFVMAHNKRQHYVPKFVLKRFSCDTDGRQINILNISRRKKILGGSLRDQCYRDYFYGDKGELEDHLCKLEGVFAKVCNDIVMKDIVNQREAFQIIMMIALQKNRTLRAEDEINGMLDKFAKVMMYGKVTEADLRSVEIGLKNGVAAFLGRALALSPVMLDLKKFLILNKTDIPFIVSDNPVVFTNWFARKMGLTRSLIGMSNSGLQIFVPVSPKHGLYLHDSNVYSAEAERNTIVLYKDSS